MYFNLESDSKVWLWKINMVKWFIFCTFLHLSYLTPKNAPQYLPWFNLVKMESMGVTFLTPEWAMTWGEPICKHLCCGGLPRPGLIKIKSDIGCPLMLALKKGPYTWLFHCIVAAEETGPYSTELATLLGPHISSSLRTKNLCKLYTPHCTVWLGYLFPKDSLSFW